MILNGNCKLYKINLKSSGTNILTQGQSFIGYGSDVGILLGSIYKLFSNTVKQYSTDVIKPFILLCESSFQASSMFKNIKSDKLRFNKLSAEIQKQKIMDIRNNTQTLEDTKISSQDLSESLERGKRLSLNNGIFKPEDFKMSIDAN